MSVTTMQLRHYQDTDSLYIDLSAKVGAEVREVAPGVVIDFDTEGHIVGIDIDHASQLVDLSRVETESLPLAKPRG
jgi:uncharacterized protein YuzE